MNSAILLWLYRSISNILLITLLKSKIYLIEIVLLDVLLTRISASFLSNRPKDTRLSNKF